MRKGCLDNTVTESSAPEFVDGIRCMREKHPYEAIEHFLKFHDVGEVYREQTCFHLAECYLQTGWRGQALEWIAQALAHNPENEAYLALRAEVFEADHRQVEKLAGELRGRARSRESARTLAQAEFLYRYHGRMLREHGVIISAYARAVEIELRQQFLPKLRRMIEKHGLEDKTGSKPYIRTGNGKVFADAPDCKFTLGLWSQLFHQERPEERFRKNGEFYQCLSATYGGTVSYKKLVAFGKVLTELKTLRNPASHGAVDNWATVCIARDLAYKALQGVATTTSNILQ